MRRQATRSLVTGPDVPAGTGVALLARLRLGTGQLATRASISSISYVVSNVTTGTRLGAGAFATTTIYDSLQQNDARWQEDSADAPGPDGTWGYNWAAAVPASLFALATLAEPGILTAEADPEQIQCDVKFTPASGEVFREIFRWRVLPTYG